MIRFIAEIAFRYGAVVKATPSNNYSRQYNIYEFDIGPPPESSYWLDWGGNYDDKYVGTNIELYFDKFLTPVGSITDLKGTDNSLFIDGTTVYFNIPKHPWLYADYEAEGENVIPFLSSPLDPNNPSNNIVKGEQAQVRLAIPSFTSKLSDNISGITFNQIFTITLDNKDGYFDNDDEWDLFNTPVTVRKAIEEIPAYSNFSPMMRGYVGSTKTTFDDFTIDVQDRVRNLEESVCTVVQQADFPDITLDDNAIGKSIPVIYGKKKVKLIKLDDADHYVGAESITSIQEVYDKDGNAITYSLSGIVITATDAETAIITGYASNKTAMIIRDIIERKSSVRYNNSNWNQAEFNTYNAQAPLVNIVFTGGTVKNAIDEVLKSDMAFFIQQSDGRFTLRKYGQTYGNHIITAWAVTKKPEKDFDKAHDNFFSSCLIKYNFTGSDRETYSEYWYRYREKDAQDQYRKKMIKEFETDLITLVDAQNLADLLGSRYTIMRQRLKLSLGIDTMIFALLDTITFDPTINGRKFSNATRFIIIEINYAQDTIILEEQ
jgi:hypothetical protein